MNKIIGSHSSPGVYTKFTDLSYAANSIGITTLGLVGETLKGPAFEPIMISDWSKYQDYFGGTSAEKFQGTQYPKYELPYIAKSYLSASDQLYVCRVLGLSGYNAGPAFVLTAEKSVPPMPTDGTSSVTDGTNNKYVIALLRSRGSYNTTGDTMNCNSTASTSYDTLTYFCDEIEIAPATKNDFGYNECTEDIYNGGNPAGLNIDQNNYGVFNITTKKGGKIKNTYTVSLNPNSKNYIYNVLGSNPNDGNADVFVEELYDYYLEDLIIEGKVNAISSTVETIKEAILEEVADAVADFVSIPKDKLNRTNLGQTYLVDSNAIENSGLYFYEDAQVSVGDIVKVISKFDNSGKRIYTYEVIGKLKNAEPDAKTIQVVKVLSQGVYYYKNEQNKLND